MTVRDLIQLLTSVDPYMQVETPEGEQMCSLIVFVNSKGIPCIWLE